VLSASVAVTPGSPIKLPNYITTRWQSVIECCLEIRQGQRHAACQCILSSIFAELNASRW